jgi:hypothetical protein
LPQPHRLHHGMGGFCTRSSRFSPAHITPTDTIVQWSGTELGGLMKTLESNAGALHD